MYQVLLANYLYLERTERKKMRPLWVALAPKLEVVEQIQSVPVTWFLPYETERQIFH